MIRLPGQTSHVAIRKSAVVAVVYSPAVPAHEELNAYTSITRNSTRTTIPVPEQPEFCIITIDGGQKFLVPRVTFWQVLEWLK
jgi:hypothetical protein